MSDIERRLRELGERTRTEQGPATLPTHVKSRVKRRRLARLATSVLVTAALAFGGVVAVGAFEPPTEIGPAEGSGEVLIDYHRTGGFAGEDVRMTVRTDGSAVVTEVEGGESSRTEHELRDADMRGLEAAIEPVDWAETALRPRGRPAGADLVEYELRYEDYVVSGYYRSGPPEVDDLIGYLDSLLGDFRIEREVANPAPTLTLADTTVSPGDVVELRIEAVGQNMWGSTTGLDAQRGDDWERLFHWATDPGEGPRPIEATRREGAKTSGHTGSATFQLLIPQLDPGIYRITKEFIQPDPDEFGELRTVTAEVHFEVTGNAPDEDPFGAIWPDDTLAEAEASCAASEGDRDDPVAVAVAFVTGVLEWDTPEQLVLRNASQGRRDIEIRRAPDDDGPRADGPAVMVYMNEVLDDCWSVGSVARLLDKRPTGVSVGVTDREFGIGFDDLGASSVTLIVGHGENEMRVDRDDGSTLIQFRLDYAPTETGHYLLLFRDETGAVFSAAGGPLPAGNFAAG